MLGVHLGTINNWVIRGILPQPVSHPKLLGNKNWFRISAIKAWLDSRTEEEIIWDWVRDVLPDLSVVKNLPQLESIVNCCYDLYDLKKPNIPISISAK